MAELVTFGYYLIAFLVVLSLVVVVHEWGHFFMARRCGVQVVAFSIGFGKKLLKWTDRKGTEWRLCAIPLGGYVQMLGDEDAASMKKSTKGLTAAQKKKTFLAKPLWQRALIIFSGPLMNYLFAIVLLAVVIATVGYVHIAPVVGSVKEGSVAEAARVLPGDRILAINGQAIKDFTEIKRVVTISKFGQELTLKIDRAGIVQELKATPKVVGSESVPQLGITADVKEENMTYERAPIHMAFVKSVEMVCDTTIDTVQYLGQVLTGKRRADDMRGPLGIAEASGDAAKSGFLVFILFIVQVSVGIGFINLLPVPLLDGGHLVMYAVEAVTRRPISERIQNWALRVGMVLLIALFAFTLFKDVPRLIGRVFGI